MKMIIRHVIISILVLFVTGSKAFSQESLDKQINEAEFFLQKFVSENNKFEQSKYLNKLGYLYWESFQLDKAIDRFKKSIAINEEYGNSNAIRTLCSNIGIIYTDLSDYDNAVTFLNKALRINKQLNKKDNIVENLINISLALQSQSKLNESIKQLEEASKIAEEILDLNSLGSIYGMLAENYEKLGDSKKSQANYDKAAAISKHLQQEELKKFQARTKEAENEASMKEKQLESTVDTLNQVLEVTREKQLQIELLNNEKKLKDLAIKEHQAIEKTMLVQERNRKLIISSLSIILLLIGGSLVFIFYQLKEKKKAYVLLEKQKEEIRQNKDDIEIQHNVMRKQNQKITDSINYAKRIQSAVLPPKETLDKVFNDYFIFFRPRDIVSGDFYWFAEKEGIIIMAIADCTGHGVPGAFMSMLGVAFLNEIVNKMSGNKHISSLQSDEILNQLRDQVISALHQTGEAEGSKDGMDIALCLIDYDKKIIQYSGAHNALYLVHNNELVSHDADKMPIGIRHGGNLPFTNNEIKFEIGDSIYMFSDGYVDQLNGLTGMKLKSSNFKKYLSGICTRSMEEQKMLLENYHDEWKAGREQIDDVLVMGIRLNERKKKKMQNNAIDWSSKRVLIVEDKDINYFLLNEALKHTNAHVMRANHGQEAVDFCKTNEFDLILMDINMPIMNGFEATKTIREFNKKIPIVAQTAQIEEYDKNHLIKDGFNDFFIKPIDLKSFIEIVGTYLND